MLDVDMDCEQATGDGQGRRWFELKAFMVTNMMTAPAPMPGWEGDIAQSSNPPPPYASRNHMGLCGMVNVFVANYPKRPAGKDPNSTSFATPSYTYLMPTDDRGASGQVMQQTPCIAPEAERRCVGNIAQTCRQVDGGMFFRTMQDCNASSAGGNYVQMCRRSTGQCCTPGFGGNCL
jgi:hypothetical protein